MARKYRGNDTITSMTITKDDIDKLEALCKENGHNRSAMMRQLIRKEYERMLKRQHVSGDFKPAGNRLLVGDNG